MTTRNQPTEHERFHRARGDHGTEGPARRDEKARRKDTRLESARKSVEGEMSRPIVAGAMTGAVVLGAALTFGALPTAVGAAAAYAVYRELKKRRAAQA